MDYITKARARFAAKLATKNEAGCVLWLGSITTEGYVQFYFGGRLIKSHRAAWILTNGEIPGGLCVLHMCDVRPCVNLEHLFLGTRPDNTHDMDAKGRRVSLQGEEHGSAVLSESQVRAIILDPRVQQRIADEYGITQAHVSEIKRGRVWRHLPEIQEIKP